MLIAVTLETPALDPIVLLSAVPVDRATPVPAEANALATRADPMTLEDEVPTDTATLGRVTGASSSRIKASQSSQDGRGCKPATMAMAEPMPADEAVAD